MKKNLIYVLSVMAILFGGCSKVITFEPDQNDIDLYSKVYMPQAERPIATIPISTDGDNLTFMYNAYLGGPVTLGTDIRVDFSVDEGKIAEYNTRYSTGYSLLPANAYELGSTESTISAGSRTTGDLKLTIKPGTYLTMFETYLLPITISNVSGSQINQDLTTTYFLFTVTYKPGEVPAEKVLSLGTNWGAILSNGARGSLIRKNNANEIMIYAPDVNGIFSAPPRVVAINFNEAGSFYYINETSLVVRNLGPWFGLFNFRIDDNHNLPIIEPHFLGDFWDKYIIVPFKNYLLTVDDQGVMKRQPVSTDVNAPKVQVGTGFTGFKQILTYGNYLLALENTTGKLWMYNMSEDGVPGNRRQMGEGWDLYEKIIVSGEDILGLDNKGDVYRYKINPNGFYPLK